MGVFIEPVAGHVGHGLAEFFAFFHFLNRISNDGAYRSFHAAIFSVEAGLFFFDPRREVWRQRDGDSREFFVGAHIISVTPDMKKANDQ